MRTHRHLGVSAAQGWLEAPDLLSAVCNRHLLLTSHTATHLQMAGAGGEHPCAPSFLHPYVLAQALHQAHPLPAAAVLSHGLGSAAMGTRV